MPPNDRKYKQHKTIQINPPYGVAYFSQITTPAIDCHIIYCNLISVIVRAGLQRFITPANGDKIKAWQSKGVGGKDSRGGRRRMPLPQMKPWAPATLHTSLTGQTYGKLCLHGDKCCITMKLLATFLGFTKLPHSCAEV